MKALGVIEKTSVGELSKKIKELELPIPKPNKNELCIEVHSSAIIINDIQMIEGSMLGGIPISPKPTKENPAIPGTDVSGIVKEIGSGVTKFKVGQRIYGMCNPMKKNGPWAEYCLVNESHIDLMPDYLDFIESAALPLVGSVAVNAIDSVGELKGKTCLIIGASGGIGSVCIQALESMDTTIWAVCSGKNAEMVKELGATRVWDYTDKPFAEQILDSGELVDIIIDCVGGKEIENQAMSILKPKGKFATVVGPVQFIGEKKLGFFKLLSMFSYIGWRSLSTMLTGRKRYIFTGASAPNFKRINELFVNHKKKVTIDRILTLEKGQIEEGIKLILSHRAKGKVVIKVK
jgi:NADPH:quinone reductase-like Zn-dependent oxidoreductase